MLKNHPTCICRGNSMICRNIWHKIYAKYNNFEISLVVFIKYNEWYFKIALHNFTSPQASEIWGNFLNITSGIYAKYHVQFMLVYTTTWEIQSSNAMCLFSSSCFASKASKLVLKFMFSAQLVQTLSRVDVLFSVFWFS